MIEVVFAVAIFLIGFAMGQEFHSKAPNGFCARCNEALKDDEGSMCAVCVEASMFTEELL